VTELLIVFTEFPPPELVVLCVTETELDRSCPPDSGSGAGREGTMGACDGLWVQREVPEKTRPMTRVRRIDPSGNCLEAVIGAAMLLISTLVLILVLTSLLQHVTRPFPERLDW
jgi:hypothetical protein